MSFERQSAENFELSQDQSSERDGDLEDQASKNSEQTPGERDPQSGNSQEAFEKKVQEFQLLVIQKYAERHELDFEGGFMKWTQETKAAEYFRNYIEEHSEILDEYEEDADAAAEELLLEIEERMNAENEEEDTTEAA
jgi:hypothetical protein